MTKGGKQAPARAKKRRPPRWSGGGLSRSFRPRLEMLECRFLLSITPSTVVGRYLFYEQSAYDGGAGVDSLDDQAIAAEKTPYFAGGGAASSAALSTFSRGINGIMIDLQGDGSHTSISASDFIFKTGNDNTPSGWATTADPTAITVRTGAGISGSDRVEIIWDSNAVKKKWLEVQLLNTTNTGLAAKDVFYWANLIGDSNLNFLASGADASSVLANIGGAASISSARDHNRSGIISGADASATLANIGGLTRVNIESPPALDAALANDTGPGGVPDHDHITSDPTIAGTLTALHGVVNFRASIDPAGPEPTVPGQTVTIDWSTVRDPGNAGELSGGGAPSHSGGGVDGIVGAVPYSYRIGTYDVTNSQYVQFLNAKDPTGANALLLYATQMTTDTANGGIGFNANQPSGSKYSVILGHGDYPVVYVSWFDSIRFVNWLNNGQGSGDTETGTYTIADGGNHGENIARNPAATVFLASEDEWYKAAYYNRGNSTYWHYATQSNDVPDYHAPPGGNNSANYVPGGWPDPNYELSIGHVTPVGAFATSVSPYGTFDQAGNVLQWTDTLINSASGPTRSLRGGSYQYVWDHMSAAYRDSADPNSETSAVGFRVSSIVTTDALPLLQTDGSFVLSESFLDALNHGPLADGSYVVHLETFDSFNLVSTIDVAFTLDRSAPAALPEVTESAPDFNAVASILAAPPLANAATPLAAPFTVASVPADSAADDNPGAVGESCADLSWIDEDLGSRNRRAGGDAKTVDFVLGALCDEVLP